MVQALADSYLQKQDLIGKYQEADADRAARLETINRLTLQLKEFEDVRTAQFELHCISRQLQETQSVLKALLRGRVFRALRRLGFWGGMENLIHAALDSDFVEATGSPPPSSDHFKSPFRRVSLAVSPLT